MTIDREAARAAGYSDAEIDAYEAERKKQPQMVAQPQGNEPPPPPPPSPTQGEASGTNLPEMAFTYGSYLPDVAKYGAGAYGVYKAGQYMSSKADLARAQAELARSRIPTPAPTAPVAAPPAPVAAPPAPPAPVAPTPSAGGMPANIPAGQEPTMPRGNAPAPSNTSAPRPMPTTTAGPQPIQVAKGTAVDQYLTQKAREAAASRITPAAVGGMMALPGALSLPYMGAAYEQAKIRANPTAPGLESNPYAQMYRGEYPTQGAAGAANRRATMNRPNTGYQLTAQEAQNVYESGDQRMIDLYKQDRELSALIKRKAAEKILGPVAPR